MMALVLALEMLGGVSREWLSPAASPGSAQCLGGEPISAILWTGGLRLIQLGAVLAYLAVGPIGLAALDLELGASKKGLKWGCDASAALAALACLAEAGYRLAGGSFLKTAVLGNGASLPAGFSATLAYLPVACLVGPLMEEIFFRGLLQQLLRGFAGRALSVLISAASFAAAHAFVSGGFNPVTHVVGGLLFAFLYEKSKSLLAPVIVHVAGNSAITLLGYLLA
jgi:hypothetical protein